MAQGLGRHTHSLRPREARASPRHGLAGTGPRENPRTACLPGRRAMVGAARRSPDRASRSRQRSRTHRPRRAVRGRFPARGLRRRPRSPPSSALAHCRCPRRARQLPAPRGQLTQGRHIFVRPERPLSTARNLHRGARAAVEAGESILFFPQGSILGIEIAFQPGAFTLAARLGRPLLPVLVTGGHRVWEYPSRPPCARTSR